jgi:hypothetical protein
VKIPQLATADRSHHGDHFRTSVLRPPDFRQGLRRINRSVLHYRG